MRARVDDALCVGHGRCYEIAPDIFGDDERGHCVLLRKTVPKQHEAATRRAEANCPERAITVHEERAADDDGHSQAHQFINPLRIDRVFIRCRVLSHPFGATCYVCSLSFCGRASPDLRRIVL